MWNFFVVMMSPIFINRLKWGTYLFFAVLSYSFVFVVWKWYPETSNISLEDIDKVRTVAVHPQTHSTPSRGN